jgi:hypothetical protein
VSQVLGMPMSRSVIEFREPFSEIAVVIGCHAVDVLVEPECRLTDAELRQRWPNILSETRQNQR